MRREGKYCAGRLNTAYEPSDIAQERLNTAYEPSDIAYEFQNIA
jgi:hypothetical protein